MELMAAVLAQHKIPVIISEGAEANPYMLLGLDMYKLIPGEGSANPRNPVKKGAMQGGRTGR